MRRRFFIDAFQGDCAILRGAAAHHLGRVLRAAPGQLFELSDGATVRLARVESVAAKEICFTLLDPIQSCEPRLRIALLLSIIKFERFEWCLEKATELGVAEIIPLAAARSERPLVVAAAKRAARWQKILLESAQQSRRLRPPVLHPLVSSDDAFSSVRALLAAPFSHAVPDVPLLAAPLLSQKRVILSERPEAPQLRSAIPCEATNLQFSLTSTLHPSQPHALLAIGPEGGWTGAELSAARAASFTEASLGPNILRTETAVIAALAVLNFALGE